jgi:Zn-dependent oligopeptidase
VYALGIFETMMKDETKFEEQCMRFRDMLLKPGGSRPPSELLEDFFGEDLSLKEIIQRFGIEHA